MAISAVRTTTSPGRRPTRPRSCGRLRAWSRPRPHRRRGPAPSGCPPTVAGVIAKVEPLTSARALRGPFDYALTGEMSALGVGSVVMVPFARRQVLGVVVELAEKSELPPERLATPLRALEADVPPELVRLGLWVAEEYCSTPARGLALVLPPGTGTGAKQRARPRTALEAALTDAGRIVVEAAAGEATLAGDALEQAGAQSRIGPAQRRVLDALHRAPMGAADL